MKLQRFGPVLVRYLTRDDAQNFKEEDHPRKKGQFVKKGTGGESGGEKTKAPNKGRVEKGAPFHPQANAPVGIKQMHSIATNPNIPPEIKLKELKAVAESKSTTPTATAFYHKYLGQMEAAVAALHAGDLKGAPSSAAEASKPIAGEASPAQATVEPSKPTIADLEKYGWGSKAVSKKIIDIVSSTKSDDEKKIAIKETLSSSGNHYSQGALKTIYQGLGITTSTPAPAPPPKLTPPHPESVAQGKMHKIALDPSLSDADKKQQISALQLGPNSKTYAQQLFKELGIADAPASSGPSATPASSGPSATPASSGPSATPAPKVVAPSAIVSKRPSDQKLLARFSTAKDLHGAGTDAQRQVIPMTGSGLTKVLTPEQHASLTSYTGNAYSAMNQALRDPTANDVPQHYVDMINHIDEAFDHPQARVTSDVQLHRNMNLPTGEIDKIVKSLEKGLPTKLMMHGFVSTSTDPGIGMGSSGNLRVHVLVEQGARAINVKSISKVKSEDEVLLPHGQHFTVVGAEKKGSRWHLQVVAHP